MKKLILTRGVSAAILASLLAATPSLAQTPPRPAAPAPANALPAPRILVIDRNVILRLSAAGKDMLAQAQKLSQSAEGQFKAEGAGLQKEAQGLQQQMAILSPEMRQQKERAFNAKQQALQQKVQQRQAQIQAGFSKAGRELDAALGPILQQIMKERGANLMMDRNSIVLASIDVDVTATAIERLDKKLPSVKVALVNVPAAGAKPPTTP